MFDITSKLEINMDDPTIPIPVITEWATKYRVASIVCYDPALIHPLIQSRISANGKYKIILAVDFDKGDQYAMSKFRGYTPESDIMLVDGFDIRLTNAKAQNIVLNEVEVHNEVKVLKDFLFGIKSTFDIRFVVDILSRGNSDQVEYALKAIAKNPCNMIRLDKSLLMHESKANSDSIKRSIDIIRRHTATPVKISTNVTRDMINDLSGLASRYDVSMIGLQNIVNSYSDDGSKVESDLFEFSEELSESELKAMIAARAVVKTKAQDIVKIQGDKNEESHLRVQKSMEVNSKMFTTAPLRSKKQNTGPTVTPPPKNAKRQ